MKGTDVITQVLSLCFARYAQIILCCFYSHVSDL